MTYSEFFDILMEAFQNPTAAASADPTMRATAVRRAIKKKLGLTKDEADAVLVALWQVFDFSGPMETAVDMLKNIYGDYDAWKSGQEQDAVVEDDWD